MVRWAPHSLAAAMSSYSEVGILVHRVLQMKTKDTTGQEDYWNLGVDAVMSKSSEDKFTLILNTSLKSDVMFIQHSGNKW